MVCDRLHAEAPLARLGRTALAANKAVSLGAWPDGAGSRWFGGFDDSKSSSSLGVDGWLRTLMRQQATFEDVTLVLHGCHFVLNLSA